MKTIFAAFAVLSCSTIAVLPSHAQEISLNVENTNLAEVVQAISLQSKVSVIVANGVTGEIKQLHLDKVKPEIALQKVVQLSALSLTKVNGNTYLIKQKPLATTESVDVNKIVENDKLYSIKFRLADTVTQEIQVRENDNFNIATKLANTQWVVKGTNTVAATGMTVKMQIERTQDMGAEGRKFESVQTMFHTPADGKDMVLPGADFSIVVSLSKNAS